MIQWIRGPIDKIKDRKGVTLAVPVLGEGEGDEEEEKEEEENLLKGLHWKFTGPTAPIQ